MPSSGWITDLFSYAVSKSKTGSKTSYSTLINLRASSATLSSTAATIATSSPTYLTYSSKMNLSCGDGSG